jgi:2-hydroxy-4-(methylsulfanyl)butanoate S-methyltransferase
MRLTNTNDIYEMMQAYIGSAALNAALELGLFWVLAQQPDTAQGIAQILEIPTPRCQYWLEVLLEMGLLERVDNIYSVSATTRTAILEAHSREAWSFRGRYWQERYPAVVDLARTIHQVGSVWVAQGRDAPNDYQRLQSDPDWASGFTQMGYEFHQQMANEITATLNMTNVQRMMDLGGGSGVISLALLERYPQLTSVVVDVEPVCKAGQRIASTSSVADRITYFPADFVNDELPPGFDLVLECEVGIYDLSLFRKIYTLLHANGRLVLAAPWAPAEGLPPTGEAKSSFLGTLTDPDFQYTESSAKQALLAEAGFQRFSERGLSRGRFLLEAWK